MVIRAGQNILLFNVYTFCRHMSTNVLDNMPIGVDQDICIAGYIAFKTMSLHGIASYVTKFESQSSRQNLAAGAVSSQQSSSASKGKGKAKLWHLFLS